MNVGRSCAQNIGQALTRRLCELPIAGDDATAKELVAKLIDELGFDTVDAGG